MAERQRHGNENEKYCCEKFNLLKTSDINYISPWDARTKSGIATSLKTHRRGNFELGSYWRQSSVNEDFYFIGRLWDKNKENIIKEVKYLIPAERWNKLFSQAVTSRLETAFEGISCEYSCDAKWKARLKELKQFVKENSDNIIKVYFKRDHKGQKRIQCAITPDNLEKYFSDCKVVEVI